jgi:hypothetical protein
MTGYWGHMDGLDQSVKVYRYKLSVRRGPAQIYPCATLSIRILNGRKILSHRTELTLELKAMSLVDEGPHRIALRLPRRDFNAESKCVLLIALERSPLIEEIVP